MDVPTFAPTPEALSKALAGVAVEGLAGGYALAAPPLTATRFPASDPRKNWNFSRASFLYAPRKSRRGDGLHLITLLHYDDPDRDTASRAGRLASRLLRLHRERFGLEATFPRMNDTVHLWLTRERPVSVDGVRLSGETWNNQLYIYDVGGERSSMEWVRTIAHEWGHLTIPAARGYRDPEGDASGFLGERLHMRWLYEDKLRDPAPGSDGVEVKDLTTYHARQIAPLMARFAAGGPLSHEIDGDRTDNMDYYVASALAFESAFNSGLLGKAIFSINDVAPRDLIRAMVSVADRQEKLTVRLPAWVPLTRSSYRLLSSRAGKIALADRPPITLKANTPFRLDLRLAGWKSVRPIAGGIETVTFQRV